MRKLIIVGLVAISALVVWLVLLTKSHVESVRGKVLTNKGKYPLSESVAWLGPMASRIDKDLGLILPLMPKLLAEGTHKEYLVLLQNNMELRPTGGFLGSYARLSFTDGFLDKIKVEDIYAPDGQLPGYVDPPDPIKKYLNSNGWFLRDSNWDPDFGRAAPVIEWFFEQGKETPADGMIAINLYVVQNLLGVTGPIYLADYQETVDADNLFEKAETHSEVNFFSGSTQKRDFLSQVANQLLEKIKSADGRKQLKILQALKHSLRQKQILVWMKDEQEARVLRQLNWDGKLTPGEGDYLMIVEANLGVNKTNCCLDRSIDHEVRLEDGKLKTKLVISYKNNNPVKPEPPRFWGGGYKNYLRVYLPKAANVEVIETIDEEVTDKFKVVGFLVEVSGGETKRVEIRYSQPVTDEFVYRIKVQKQSGTTADPYTLILDSPTCPTAQLNRNLDEDFTWEAKLRCAN